MHRSFTLLILLVCAFLLGRSCQAKSQPLKIVPELDLNRYVGTWHEIARLPNSFQRKCTGDVTGTYSLRDDGTINVVNQCATTTSMQRVIGIGKFKDPNSKVGHLKVTFAPEYIRVLPFVWGDYCVIELDPDYQFVLVGEPSRRYLWILSKDENLPQEQYDRLVTIAKEQGFDTDKLIRTN